MTDSIAHFDDEAWHGFACGILPESNEQEMRAHLDRGCAECQRNHQIWRRFVETASREAADAMTDSADCLAKPVLALRRRIPFRAGLALFARRVFDSFLDPSPMGVRGAAAASRQLVFEAGGYLIDLQIEQGNRGSGAIAGQVVHAWTEGATGGAAIVLVREDSVIDQTVANSIGEFQFDGDYGDEVKICLGISDDTFIEVPLPDAGPEPPAAGSANEATNDNSENWRKKKK